MTVFNNSETRRDRKNPVLDLKSTPQNLPKTAEKNPPIHTINFFCCSKL